MQAEIGRHEEELRCNAANLLEEIVRTEGSLDAVRMRIRTEESLRNDELRRLATASERRDDEEALYARLQSEAKCRREQLGAAESQQASEEFSLADAEAEARGAEASLSVLSSQLRDLEAAERTGGAALQELELRQQQLHGLLQGLENANAKLEIKTRDQQAEMEDEQRQALELEKSRASKRLEDLSHEAQQLRQTLQALDEDRRELQGVAAKKQQEVAQLRQKEGQLQSSRAEWQWKLTQLQHQADLQHGELTTSAHEAAALQAELGRMESEVLKAQTEVQEHSREASLGLEDLLHMTRENQLLQTELQRTRQREAALAAAAQDNRSQVLPRTQALKGMEMEHATALRAYQEALAGRQRNEEAVVELACQTERSQLEVVAFQERLNATLLSEEAARAVLLQTHAKMLAFRSRLSETARALELQELAAESAGVQRSQLRLAMGAHQAAIADVLGSAAAAGEVDGLRHDIEALQAETQGIKQTALEVRRQREDAERRHAQLQGLLAQQRLEQQRLETELTRLQERFQGAASVPLEPVVNPAANLRQTLERQDILLNEMETECAVLAKEAVEFRRQLRARGIAFDEADAP